MVTNLSTTSSKIFECLLCDHRCSKKSDFIKHELTRKHLNHLKGDEKIAEKTFTCEFCNKLYNSRNGLWKHNKLCTKSDTSKDLMSTILKDNFDFKNLVLDIIKQNHELNKQNQELNKQNHELNKHVLEVCQNGSGNHNTSNSHNKTFNLNFFLNEQCKDAMNIMDFVDTFKLDFADLDNVGKLGYVEGISNIIIQKLNEMDIYKRPIHCSDLKRETTHVKDKGVWEKDNGNHDKFRLAIRHIAKKNSDMLNPWIEAHPHAQASAHYLNNVYMNYIMQAMGGRGDIDDNETKIIKKIAKVILIDK